ncbi:hypothetical protein KI387_006290, partial [Taxus chinensis]
WEIQGSGNLPDLSRFVRQTDSASNLYSSETKPADNRLAVVPGVPSQFTTCVQELSSDQKPDRCDKRMSDIWGRKTGSEVLLRVLIQIVNHKDKNIVSK